MKKKESKRGIIAIITIIVLLVFGTIMMLMKLSTKVQMNTLPISGNTTGNLNNSGLFCESNGILYFANAYDNYALYSYNHNNGKCKKITDGPIKSINADSHYIYYVRQASPTKGTFGFSSSAFVGLYRMDFNGNHKTCLYSGSVENAQLINNKLFFQKF